MLLEFLDALCIETVDLAAETPQSVGPVAHRR
jgi:hypothetical protein